MRHFLDLLEVSADDVGALFHDADCLKKAWKAGVPTPVLAGRVVALIFEKPSLRTRVSFQAGISQLGGASLFLSGQEAGLGGRETLPDVARTLGEYVDALVLRTFAHDTIVQFAHHAGRPVINGLSDYYHPCQAVADLFTMHEVFGDVGGLTLAFVGDGNNVARSLAILCAKLGVKFVLSAPSGYTFDKPFLDLYRRELPHGDMKIVASPKQAVKSADVIYTDVWTSMGQEAENDERRQRFAAFQVNAELLAAAPAHAKVMHCLPARRGEEITDEALDGPRSVVFQQAGNRMHAQKALLRWAIGGQ